MQISPKVDERPLLLPLTALMGGIAYGGLTSQFVAPMLLLPLFILTLLTIFSNRRIPFFVALAALLFCCGNVALKSFVAPDLKGDHVARLVSDEPRVVEGVIDVRPEPTETGTKIHVSVQRVVTDRTPAPASGRLLVYVKTGRTPFLTGDLVRFSSRIREPRNLGLPGEFDHVAYLSYRTIHATAFVEDADDVILIRQGVDYPLQRSMDMLARRIGSFIDAHVSQPEASILRALLIGEAASIPKAIRDAYSLTGVNHILSISGFHVGIIALFVFQVLMAAARTSEFLLLQLNLRRFILAVTLPLMVFYLFLSGGAPATARSVIMIAIYILALLIQRQVDPVNTLMAAALFLLILTPPALFDVSFQLSFLALWGIVVLTPLFMKLFPQVQEGRIAHKLLLFLMASAAATAATVLPVAYYFHRVSATGLISNFFIVPLMGYGAVVLGFSAIPFSFGAPLVAQPLVTAAAWLVTLSNQIVMFLADIPTLPVLNPSRFDLLLSYLLLSALTFISPGKHRLACCGILGFICAGSMLLPADGPSGRFEVTFFSVGQGESTLITFPDGKRMLVDGGGNVRDGGQDVGERLLAPALWKLGVRKIDYVVLSHSHPDHMQGLNYVVANFAVGEFWEGVPPAVATSDYVKLQQTLAKRRIPVRRLGAGSGTIMVGEAQVQPLAPFHHALSSEADEEDTNDDSLVFRVVLGEFSMLFTGDIGFATEQRLCLHPEKLKSTVLKVPHHGSRYSSSEPFLDAAAPRIALISAGYRNSFHHPAPETIDHLHRRHIKTHRTDLDGTIRVSWDREGRNLASETVKGHFH